jgi:glycosyltransferase involved in cell wall biosynthesis
MDGTTAAHFADDGIQPRKKCFRDAGCFRIGSERKMKTSFCLITLNEEQNLRRCLKSCAGLADEIVVLDSGSTDKTEQIAREFDARFEHQDWLGYVGQKNKLISLASNEWIFSLDADEELSPELYAEIKLIKSAGDIGNDMSGFSMPRCVLYEGRWIRHGDWYPDRLVRWFRRDAAKFSGGKVHERLEISGRIVPLRGEIFHHSFRDVADHRARCEKYARLWAEEKFAAGQKANALAPAFHAAFRWLRGYILRRGFLDGAQGWQIARLCAWETYLKYKWLRQFNDAESVK